jgi:hypothetical protein
MATSTATLKTTRAFRRLRSQFKADLSLETLTRADRVLIDQASLLALRAQQMRDAILSGEAAVDDDSLVRVTNAAIRAMKSVSERKDRGKPDHVPFWQQPPIEEDE